ncbi:hypothetical protein ANO14919_109540 [Xylariales sp. No.14919]|nr:hypothetical protein ANO14919_109540 [Xylariales sp. No.14919]
MEEIMNPIRVIATQRLIAPYGSTETTSRITADGVEELLKINKSIKWYMEEFAIHLPFQEPKAQEVSKSLSRYAKLLIEALRLDFIAPERNTSHVIIHVQEDATITQKRPTSVGALRWEVLQNRDLWSAEARPASVSVVRILRADVEEVPVPSTNLNSSSTFNILALTARPNNVNDIPHRLITKSIYDVVAKANGQLETRGGSAGEQRTTLSIVRPGSLEALKQELKKGGRYDIVHLDLHGKVEDCRAYALFINEIKREAQLVSAEDLAGLLSSHGVRTVILNACQSAVEGEGPSANLAKALIQNGIKTVVAMGYKVLDVTARLFVSSFYDQLLRLNRSPLLAAQAARQCLLNKRTKKTNYLTEVPLDDYLVPSVYIGDGGMNYVDHELSISDLEMLRTSPPELPPDRSVDVDMNLIGREGELLMLKMDLMLESCITAIEGPPGVGKSALINGAAEWWKSTAFIDRVINIGPMALKSPESLIQVLNKELGTNLKVSDTQLDDVKARRRRIRTKIMNVLAPGEPKRKGDARGRLPKPAKATQKPVRKSTGSIGDSRLLVIFDGIEASDPRKISEPVLELIGYFLTVFRDIQVNLSAQDPDLTSGEAVAPNPYKSFVIFTTRRMPQIAILNPPVTKPTETGKNTQSTHRPVRTLATLDEDRALLLTRYILEKTNRHPDLKDWEGLLVRGQLGKLAQGNPLALKMLLSAFNPKDHNLVSFTQSLLRGDCIRLDSIHLDSDHGVLSTLRGSEQAVGDKYQDLTVFSSDSAMAILQPLIDEGFAVVGNASDRQVKSEGEYVTLHPLIPLLLRDESHRANDTYDRARKIAHDVMPKLFRYRIKSWPTNVAYWKREWDSPREILRWEFYDFLGATYRVLDMPSNMLTSNILIDLAHVTNKGLFWDAGRRPLMGAFWRAAVDKMHRERHILYEVLHQPDVVPVND